MRTFLLSFAATLALIGATFASLIALSYGSPIRNEHDWAREAVLLKRGIAQAETASPRIIIMAGSSALFGIRASVLQAETGFPAVNMAVQGSLGIRMMIDELKRSVEPGDIILFAPEENVVWTDDLDNDFSVSISFQISPNHFDNLPLWEKVGYLRMLSLPHLWAAASRRIWPDGLSPTVGYDVSKIDASGDYIGNHGVRIDSLTQLVPGVTFANTAEPGHAHSCEGPSHQKPPQAVGLLADFNGWAAASGVQLFVTYPNRINSEGNRSRSAYCFWDNIRDTVENEGIQFIGDYSHSLLPMSLMYDTDHHPNAVGSSLRTEMLASALCDKIDCH